MYVFNVYFMIGDLAWITADRLSYDYNGEETKMYTVGSYCRYTPCIQHLYT